MCGGDWRWRDSTTILFAQWTNKWVGGGGVGAPVAALALVEKIKGNNIIFMQQPRTYLLTRTSFSFFFRFYSRIFINIY